ncbi:hypothetical protein HPP92_009721 [Vanilla planifolia]|uniref:Carboxypeptidase n=1 Tax=Vanilla planifolia TaxID=51239 RepID=A0A835R8B9_VANPL|nr:hypothetical protein HPP92_009721 [Vanilla planifolia]
MFVHRKWTKFHSHINEILACSARRSWPLFDGQRLKSSLSSPTVDSCPFSKLNISFHCSSSRMASPTILTLVTLLLLNTASFIFAAQEGALISHLPGFNGNFPSKHYAGYVTVDESHGRHLFYYFVESEGNPAKDPLVLWLNGGPGCSSFDGFVYEHGPFNFKPGKEVGNLPELQLNPFSWSKVSNIIYLDSPAGVGMSFSVNEADYSTGDIKTASDSHKFLLKWFELYPEFIENPFYITGESYAGVYVPTLSAEVAEGIKVGIKPIINFKGYMIGNGVTDEKFDGDALVPFAHGMGLISDELFQETNAACSGSYWNPVNKSCEEKLTKIDMELQNLNMYDILEPCYHVPEIRDVVSYKRMLPAGFRMLGESNRPLPVRKRMFGRAWPLRAQSWKDEFLCGQSLLVNQFHARAMKLQLHG